MAKRHQILIVASVRPAEASIVDHEAVHDLTADESRGVVRSDELAGRVHHAKRFPPHQEGLV